MCQRLRDPIGLYVHIPFCKARCHYCDFATFAGEGIFRGEYLRALKKEMQAAGRHPVRTVFIGGGTPSFLSSPELRDLMTAIRTSFSLAPRAEITVECNPESVDSEKLAVLKEGGVNRLSFGLQTTDDRRLRSLGRAHTLATFRRAYTLARGQGFQNINVDLIYGLPGETLEDWKESIERVLRLDPEHISAYALTVEEDTPFGRQGVLTDDDLQAGMYLWTHERLTEEGYEHYEISNFARPGRECLHNRTYWEDLDFLGVGLSAASSVRGVRWKNVSGFKAYIERISRGHSPSEERERLEGAPKIAERLILNLRLKEGVPEDHPGSPMFEEVFARYADLGHLTRAGGHWKATPRGWLLSNQLFSDILLSAEA